MRKEIKRIREIQAKQEKLQEELNEAAKAAYPIGDTFDFFKGGSWITAKILIHIGSHTGDPNFFVRSHTGKEYRVDLYWLMNQKMHR